MNKIILRFYVVCKKEVFETIFDLRLSFLENIKLLKEVYSLDKDKDMYIVDPYKMIALKKNIPISKFNFKNFMTLYIY